MHSVVAGDLLRSQVREGTPLGKAAEAVMKAGGMHTPLPSSAALVPQTRVLSPLAPALAPLTLPPSPSAGLLPDTTVLGLIAPGLLSLSGSSWILDGFPRKASQAVLLDGLLAPREEGLNLVVSLAVPDSVILSRVMARWIHAPSNRSYNTDFPATRPKVEGRDDVTGEPLTRRPDDTEEVFGKRLEGFHAENDPILEHYGRVETTLADGRTVPVLVTLGGSTSDEIWPKLVGVIADRFPHLARKE